MTEKLLMVLINVRKYNFIVSFLAFLLTSCSVDTSTTFSTSRSPNPSPIPVTPTKVIPKVTTATIGGTKESFKNVYGSDQGNSDIFTQIDGNSVTLTVVYRTGSDDIDRAQLILLNTQDGEGEKLVGKLLPADATLLTIQPSTIQVPMHIYKSKLLANSFQDFWFVDGYGKPVQSGTLSWNCRASYTCEINLGTT